MALSESWCKKRYQHPEQIGSTKMESAKSHRLFLMHSETLGHALTTRSSEGSNNFLLLRLFAASLVVYGHGPAFAVPCAGCTDISQVLFGYRYSGDVAVQMFFVISGFLVSASIARRSIVSYFLARARRILPGLVVFILVVALVLGPAVSTLSVGKYLTNPGTWRFIWSNVTLWRFEGTVPGVFADNRFPNAVAGTLWTLFTEVRLYLLLAVIGILGGTRFPLLGAGMILGLAAYALFSGQGLPLVGNQPQYLRLSVYFGLGAVAFLTRKWVPLSWAWLAAALMIALVTRQSPHYEIGFGFLIAYATLFLGFLRPVPIPRWVEDYSYGIYLYGWPCQQLVAMLWPRLDSFQLVAISLPAAWLCGALSWHLVEKPSARLIRSLLKPPSALQAREDQVQSAPVAIEPARMPGE